MFQFFFKYPIPVFTKGRFVLLGAWPGWLLPLLIVASSVGLALLIRSRLPAALPKLRTWRGAVLWLLQSLLIAIVLVLLWQPAITVAELSSQQNIIAVLVDDSRSMALADSGSDGKTPRESAATKALQSGVLSGLQKRFQTRIYRLDSKLTRVASLDGVQPYRCGDASQRRPEAIRCRHSRSAHRRGRVAFRRRGELGGIDMGAINALGNRRLPVHAVGFGREHLAHDIALEEVNAPTSAIADSRISATVSFRQRGYAGGKATLLVRDGDKTLARAT